MLPSSDDMYLMPEPEEDDALTYATPTYNIFKVNHSNFLNVTIVVNIPIDNSINNGRFKLKRSEPLNMNSKRQHVARQLKVKV